MIKYFLFSISFMAIFLVGVSDALAQNSMSTITDTVVRIKEDDDGKIIMLKKAPQIYYLTYSTPGFDSALLVLTKSQDQKSTVKITADSKLNILKAE